MAERDFNAATHEDVDDNDDSDDPPLAEMLDPELQPEQPIPDNEESQAIYREHRRLAKEYLRVDTRLYYAQDFKEKILIGLDPEERQKKQEMLRKIKEKVSTPIISTHIHIYTYFNFVFIQFAAARTVGTLQQFKAAT